MKRYMFLALTVIILIIVGYWLVNFMTTASLEVTSAPDNHIVVTRPGNNSSFKKEGDQRVRLKLKKGIYIIDVKGNSVETKQAVTLKGRQHLSLSIRPTAASGIEPVYDGAANFVVSDNLSLLALSPASQTIFKINSDDSISSLSPASRFQTIKWSSVHYGIGQDSSGQLFEIKDGAVSLIDPPFSYASAPVNYTVDGSGNVYISSGTAVYRYKNGDFSKVYTSSSPPSLLSASGNKVAVVEELEGQGKESEGSSITVVNGTEVAGRKPTGSFVAAWSPDGKYIAISGTAGGEILDGNLKHIATIPQPNFSNPVWRDSHTLLYSLNDQIWSYDVMSQRSVLIANIPLAGAVQETSLSADGSYMYMVVRASISKPDLEVKRLPLNGQPIDKTVFMLQDILPKSTSFYTMSLVNLTRPSIHVRSNGDAPSSLYGADAASQMSRLGFDMSKIPIIFDAGGSE